VGRRGYPESRTNKSAPRAATSHSPEDFYCLRLVSAILGHTVVKLEAENVQQMVKIDKVKEVIDTIIDKTNGANLISIKDGEPHRTTGMRTICL